jgi:hypothetical protein
MCGIGEKNIAGKIDGVADGRFGGGCSDRCCWCCLCYCSRSFFCNINRSCKVGPCKIGIHNVGHKPVTHEHDTMDVNVGDKCCVDNEAERCLYVASTLFLSAAKSVKRSSKSSKSSHVGSPAAIAAMEASERARTVKLLLSTGSIAMVVMKDQRVDIF